MKKVKMIQGDKDQLWSRSADEVNHSKYRFKTYKVWWELKQEQMEQCTVWNIRKEANKES